MLIGKLQDFREIKVSIVVDFSDFLISSSVSLISLVFMDLGNLIFRLIVFHSITNHFVTGH